MGYGLMGGLGQALTNIGMRVVPQYAEGIENDRKLKLAEAAAEREATHQALMDKLAQGADARAERALGMTSEQNQWERSNADRTFGLNEKKFFTDALQPGMAVSPELRQQLGPLADSMIDPKTGRVFEGPEHGLRMRLLERQIATEGAQAAHYNQLNRNAGQENQFGNMRALDLEGKMTSPGFNSADDLMAKVVALKQDAFATGNTNPIPPGFLAMVRSRYAAERQEKINNIATLVNSKRWTPEQGAAAAKNVEDAYVTALGLAESIVGENGMKAGGGAAPSGGLAAPGGQRPQIVIPPGMFPGK